jgi:hypothetical protein
MVSKVHSPVPEITRDFTLANLIDTVINEKLPKFIREQMKTISIASDYLRVSDDILAERFDEDEIKYIKEGVEKNLESVRKLLLNEIYNMVVMSRSAKGQIIDAMLDHGRNMGIPEMPSNLKEKLMEEKKDDRRK